MNIPILARNVARVVKSHHVAPASHDEPFRVRLLGTVAVAVVLTCVAVLSLTDIAQARTKDRDLDGVPNTIDACPDIAGDASNNGCPLPPEPTPTIPVTYVNPGADLDATVNSLSSPRIYKIAQGKYTVDHPLNLDTGDELIGVYSAFPRPTITQTTTIQTIVDANGTTNVKISGLRIERAHGIKANQPATGRGVSGGNNLTLRDVRLTENANQGVGGAGPGLVIIDSEVDHNGAGASGAFYAQDGRESAAGIKSVNPMKVVNTYVHDNAWTGVWCDLECDAFEVRDSTIVRNGRAGIHDEVSSGPALFVNNRIQDNGYAPYVWGRYGGVLIVSSRNVEAYGNAFGNNTRYGVDIYEDSRSPVVDNVSVHDNQLNDDALAGCSLLGISCINNY
jgi:hypothetical protein